jgi:hypothetical protein
VPHQINYQGRLTDNQGQALPDGNYNMRFRIYDAETSGTQLWSTTRCYSPDNGTTCDGTGTDQRVSVQNGTFSLKLGKVNSLPNDIFTNPTRYLEVELPTPSTNTNTANPDWSEGPFTPRQQLNASPYAFNAEEIDGYDSDNIAILDENNTFTGNQNIFTNNTDSTTSLQVNTAAGSTIFNADTSNQRIGINNTSPTTALDVSGQGNFTGVVSGADATANNEFVTLGQLEDGSATDAFVQGGNSFGALATLGTNDTQDLALETGGAEQVRVDTSGNVGIGTTDPHDGQLVVANDNTDEAYIALQPGGNALNDFVGVRASESGNNTTKLHWGREFTSDSAFQEQVTLDAANSSLGIGTTSPGGRITVSGASAPSSYNNGVDDVAIEVDTTSNTLLQGSGATAPYRVNLEDANGAVSHLWNAYSDGTGYNYDVGSEGANWLSMAGGAYKFRTAPGGTAGNNISWNLGLAQDNSGNVGIGTTSPDNNLHVENGVKIGGSGRGDLVLHDGSNTRTVRLSANNKSYLNGGNVGIGTTTPQELLTVAGIGQMSNLRLKRDTLQDADGSSTNNFGSPDPIAENDPLVTVEAADNICANTTLVAQDIFTDSGGDCDVDDADTHTVLLGSLPAGDGTTSADANLITSSDNWSLLDNGATAGAYDDGEDLYYDRFPSLAYNSGDIKSNHADGFALGRDRTVCDQNDCTFLAKTDGDDADPDGDLSIGEKGSDGVFNSWMHFDGPSGNVGVGTTTPQAPFTLQDTGAPVGIGQNYYGGLNTMELLTEDSSGSLAPRITLRGQIDGADIEFLRGASGASQLSMLIDGGTGNVGIGTGTPGNLLEVDNSGSGNANVKVNASNGSNSLLRLTEDSSSDHGGLLRYDGSNNIFQIGTIDSGSAVPAIHIPRNEERVGINRLSPSAPLHTKTSSTTAEARIARFTANDGRSMNLLQPDNSDNTDPFTWNTGNAFQWRVDSYNSLTVAANQYVGIGINNPDQKLHVNDIVKIGSGSNTGNLLMHNGGTRTIRLNAGGDSYLNGGNVGIGTSSPSQELSLASGGDIYVSSGKIGNNSSAFNGVNRVLMDNQEAGTFSCVDGGAGAGGLYYDRSDGMFICRAGTVETIDDSGNAEQSSDIRLKENLSGLDNALGALRGMRTVRYDYKDEYVGKIPGVDKKRHVGVVAQDLADTYPELVQKKSNGYYGVFYEQLPVLSLAAVKELDASQQDLKERVSALEAQKVKGADYLSSGDDASFASLNVSGETELNDLTVTDEAEFKGKLTVKEVEVEADITAGGHIVSKGDEPEAELAESLEDVAEAEISGTDTAGQIKITVKEDKDIDTRDVKALEDNEHLMDLVFATSYEEDIAPQVTITPGNRDSAASRAYIDFSATDHESFALHALEPLQPGTTYTFSYHVTGTKNNTEDLAQE